MLVVRKLACGVMCFATMIASATVTTNLDSYVEYIQSSGTQWIDTGVIGKSTVNMAADVMVLSSAGSSCLIGERPDTGGNMKLRLGLWINDSYKWALNCGSIDSSWQGSALQNTRCVVSNENGRLWVCPYGGTPTKIYNGANQTFTSSLSLTMFFLNTASGLDQGSNRPLQARVYGLTLHDSGTLVRDFHPCRVTITDTDAGTSVTKYGLWDEINDRFYGDLSGGTDFTAGPDVATVKLVVLPIPDQTSENFGVCRPDCVVSNQYGGAAWIVGGDIASQLFDVEYTENEGAGVATVMVTGKGEYAGEQASQSFNIVATKQEDENILSSDPTARRRIVDGKYVYIFKDPSSAKTAIVKRNLAMTDYLVVGGGGGGGNAMGGGGGGGGVTNATGIVRALLSEGDTFTVSVGAGGAGAGSYNSKGANGKATSFTFGDISVSVAGGGGGGSWFNAAGADGASGGGGTQSSAGGAGIDGLGYAGATGVASSRAGGGGAGAGHAGYQYTDDPKRAGNGGEGIVSSITGEAVYYGGGGGGGADSCDPGFGGLGGGGDGKKKAAGQPGTDGFGGGGGGGSWLGTNSDSRNCGGKGGSGTVILALRPGDFNIESIPDQYLNVGTGGEFTPEPVVRADDGITLLKKGVDYTVSYTGNAQSGYAYLTVTGINDYSGKVCEISFKIYRRYFVDSEAEQEGDGSEASPFATIANAITQANAAIAGGARLVVIHAADGDYPENGLVVTNAIVIEGNASDRTAVKIGKTGGSVFLVENANAVLRNLTVRNGQSQATETYATAGGNIRLNAGVVTNCVITGATNNGNDKAGANLFVAGGTVVDCLIDGSTGARNTKGQGVYMTGGSVVRCRIVNQIAGSDTGAPTQGVGAYLTGGLIENCFIAGNASGIAALYMNGGTAVNCTIAGNTAKVSGKCVGVYVNNNAASVVNCVVFGNGGTALTEWGDNDKGARFFNCASPAEIAGGTDCVTLRSSSYLSYFEDNVAWIPFAGSPMMDAGDGTRYLISYSQTDLAGNARVRPEGGTIDIGCYEAGQDRFSFAPTLVSHPSILSGGTVDFVMLVAGAADMATFEIDFGDGASHLVTAEPSFSRQFDVAGFFHARARAKVGSEAYGEWVPITQPIRVSNADIYVSDADGNDDYAGTSSAPLKTVTKALNTLTNLLSKCETDVDGVTIHVAAGTYLENALPKISSAVTIEGVASDRTAAKIGKTGGRVFLVENADAVLRNLTVQNGLSEGAGGNIRLNAGMVTNCVISGATFDTKDRNGGNLYVTGGTVADCLIDGSTGARNTKGHGVYMTGGYVVRCRIVNQVAGYDTGAHSLGVGAYLTGGVIDNCLIAGNTSGIGALYMYGGKAVNCTIAGNSARATGKCIGVNVSNSGASVVNCVIYGNDDNSANANFGTSNLNRFFYCGSSVTNASCATWTVLSDADFVSVANGNWHQRGSSQLTDRGTVDTTYRPADCSTLDLDGNPRLLNKSVDLGCWEVESNLGFRIILR